jgi:hypothetical protein
LAGVFALVGAGVAYNIISSEPNPVGFIQDVQSGNHNVGLFYGSDGPTIYTVPLSKLILIAVIVLIASIATAILLSKRQAKRKAQPMWGTVSRSLLFHMATPLLAGGAMIFILLYWNPNHFGAFDYGLIVPIMLIFYGISLVSASNFTFTDVKYLGLFEIVVGLTAACLPRFGLLFWAFGFGILHIIYGGMMYFKYDK